MSSNFDKFLFLVLKPFVCRVQFVCLIVYFFLNFIFSCFASVCLMVFLTVMKQVVHTHLVLCVCGEFWTRRGAAS